MYHSHSYKDESFDLFVSFLKNAIKGNTSYKHLVKPVILDAHLLALGEKDYYSISRDNYSVITLLVEANEPYFKEIDPDNLSEEDYSKILGYANTQREAFLV